MKKFLKVISVILLSIITIANVLFFVMGMTNSNSLNKSNETKEAKAYYSDKDTSLNAEDWGKSYEPNIFKIDTVEKMEKYLKELEIVHVYNSDLTVNTREGKSYSYQEIATFKFKTKLWINSNYAISSFKVSENVLNHYKDETTIGNGNFQNGIRFYSPLIHYGNKECLTDTKYSDFLYPRNINKNDRTYVHRKSESNPWKSYDTGNYSIPNWTIAHTTLGGASSKFKDQLKEYIITYNNGTTETVNVTEEIIYTNISIKNNKDFVDKFTTLNFQNISKLEFHYDSYAYYYLSEIKTSKIVI